MTVIIFCQTQSNSDQEGHQKRAFCTGHTAVLPVHLTPAIRLASMVNGG